MSFYICTFMHLFTFLSSFAVRPIITKISYRSNGSESRNLPSAGERQLSLTEFTPQTELTCEAYSSPPPGIIWLKDGITLQRLTEGRVITTKRGPFNESRNITQSVLKFKEVQLSDAGKYTCRASNGNVSPIPGNTTWTLMLIIGELLHCYLLYCDDGVRHKHIFSKCTVFQFN